MACLGELYKLVSIDNPYIGCSKEKNDENVILTLADDIIVYNVENNRTLHSWKSKRGEHFTSAAIYNSQEYIVVINNKIIKTFQHDFAKGKRFTVNTFIHKIIPHNNKSYVVFEDLSIKLLDDVLENPKITSDFTDKNIKSSQLVDGSFHIISSKDGAVMLTVINMESGNSKTFKMEKNGGTKLLGSCFNKKNLVTFWSDGDICISGNIEDEIEFEQVTQLSISSQHITGEGNIITSLTDDIVAVVHSSPTNQNELVISAVDLLYGSMFTCHKSSTTDTTAQVDVFDGYLLMIKKDEISKVDYTAAQSVTLFSVSHCQQQKSTDTANYHADNFYLQAEESQKKKLEILMSNVKKNADKMLIWKELWSNMEEKKKMDLFSSEIINLLMKGLLKDENYKLISEIIKSGYLTTRVCPYLLDGLLQDGVDGELLMDFLTHVNDISEHDLVKCLDHILNSDKDVVTDEEEKILNKIISLPNTDEEVKEALINLSYPKSEILLKFLCASLEKNEIFHLDSLMYKQIISWVSNVIDVNYANFICFQDSINILIKLQDVVSLQADYMEEFRQIELFMMTMENAKKLKSKKQQDFSYKIQLMSI